MRIKLNKDFIANAAILTGALSVLIYRHFFWEPEVLDWFSGELLPLIAVGFSLGALISFLVCFILYIITSTCVGLMCYGLIRMPGSPNEKMSSKLIVLLSSAAILAIPSIVISYCLSVSINDIHSISQGVVPGGEDAWFGTLHTCLFLGFVLLAITMAIPDCSGSEAVEENN